MEHKQIFNKQHLYRGDCLVVMPKLEPIFDMAIFSPPYNVGVEYGNDGREKDKLDIGEYKEWADKIMEGTASLLVSGGRACVEIGGSGRNLPLSWIWQDAAYKAGLGLFGEIMLPHRKTNPTAWGSWLKADSVYTIPNFHSMYVFYKDTAKKVKDNGKTDIEKDEFTEWTRGVWNINYSVGRVDWHPATFPVELPRRCMKLFGHDNDIILDIFMGAGTTGLAALELNRRFVGIELREVYYQMAVKRIMNAALQIPMPLEMGEYYEHFKENQGAIRFQKRNDSE